MNGRTTGEQMDRHMDKKLYDTIIPCYHVAGYKKLKVCQPRNIGQGQKARGDAIVLIAKYIVKFHLPHTDNDELVFYTSFHIIQ